MTVSQQHADACVLVRLSYALCVVIIIVWPAAAQEDDQWTSIGLDEADISGLWIVDEPRDARLGREHYFLLAPLQRSEQQFHQVRSGQAAVEPLRAADNEEYVVAFFLPTDVNRMELRWTVWRFSELGGDAAGEDLVYMESAMKPRQVASPVRFEQNGFGQQRLCFLPDGRELDFAIPAYHQPRSGFEGLMRPSASGEPQVFLEEFLVGLPDHEALSADEARTWIHRHAHPSVAAALAKQRTREPWARADRRVISTLESVIDSASQMQTDSAQTLLDGRLLVVPIGEAKARLLVFASTVDGWRLISTTPFFHPRLARILAIYSDPTVESDGGVLPVGAE